MYVCIYLKIYVYVPFLIKYGPDYVILTPGVLLETFWYYKIHFIETLVSIIYSLTHWTVSLNFGGAPDGIRAWLRYVYGCEWSVQGRCMLSKEMSKSVRYVILCCCCWCWFTCMNWNFYILGLTVCLSINNSVHTTISFNFHYFKSW